MIRLVILVLALTSVNGNVQQKVPPRPTRTLGSLFGSSKPAVPLVPQQQQQVQHHQVSEPKSINSIPQQVLGNVRPLVYQVKYYDRIQNNLVDILDTRYNQPYVFGSNVQNVPASEKAGVVVDQPQVVGVPGGVPTHPGVYYGAPHVPQRVYYNPLIPPQPQEPVLYTIAQVGNTQVLIPCTQEPYESTIALNVDAPQPTLRVPVQHQQQQQPPAISQSPHPQRTPPQQVFQQPLVRDQVIQAAHELSALNALPGSPIQGVVGANINNVSPYTQGSYFYYYTLPTIPTYVQPQPQQVQQQRYVYNNGNVVPVVLSGYVNQPQATNTVHVRQPVPTATTQQQMSQQMTAQVQSAQTTQTQQQQQQQVKG